MTTLQGFEEGLRKSLLDQAERRLIGERDNWTNIAIRESHAVLDQAAEQLDYDIDSVKDSLQGPQVTRERNRVVVVYGWDHPAAPYFSYGVSPHTISGDPVLSYIYTDAPPEVRDMFPNTERVDGDPRVFFPEVEHPGTPALRFVRQGLKSLRLEKGA